MTVTLLQIQQQGRATKCPKLKALTSLIHSDPMNTYKLHLIESTTNLQAEIGRGGLVLAGPAERSEPFASLPARPPLSGRVL